MSVEKEEFKPGGARAGPEDACAARWVRTGRRMWKANAFVQARPNLYQGVTFWRHCRLYVLLIRSWTWIHGERFIREYGK